jgi:nucleoside-diphosphate-sugar epimerase
MRILITGARGLIGSALIERLRGEHELICQSRSPHEHEAGVRWIQHDLANDSWEAAALAELDVVYHLAGQTSTYVARNTPLADLEANVVGLLRLLQHLRGQGKPAFTVFTGTATQVGLTERLPITENMPDRPVTFYDISKLTAELYLGQYAREGWVNGCTLRLANVYGGRRPGQQSDRGILDRVFAKASAGERVTVYGDGVQLRDYVYIDDVIAALVLAPKYAANTNGRTFNIGSGRGVSLKEAFTKVASLARPEASPESLVEHVAPPADLSAIESRNAIVDSSAFSAATGWTPAFDFESGLAAAYAGRMRGQHATRAG